MLRMCEILPKLLELHATVVMFWGRLASEAVYPRACMTRRVAAFRGESPTPQNTRFIAFEFRGSPSMVRTMFAKFSAGAVMSLAMLAWTSQADAFGHHRW